LRDTQRGLGISAIIVLPAALRITRWGGHCGSFHRGGVEVEQVVGARLPCRASVGRRGKTGTLMSPRHVVELAAMLVDGMGGGAVMKYLLLFCGSAEDAAAFRALTPDELRVRYEQVGGGSPGTRQGSARLVSCRGRRRRPRYGSGRTGRRW
jgi:hypothetical protein